MIREILEQLTTTCQVCEKMKPCMAKGCSEYDTALKQIEEHYEKRIEKILKPYDKDGFIDTIIFRNDWKEIVKQNLK